MEQIVTYLNSHNLYAEINPDHTLIQGAGYMKMDEYNEAEKAPFSIRLTPLGYKVCYRNVFLGKTYSKITKSWSDALSAVLGAVGYYATF